MHVAVPCSFMFCRPRVGLHGCGFSEFLGKAKDPFLGTALGEPLDEDRGSHLWLCVSHLGRLSNAQGQALPQKTGSPCLGAGPCIPGWPMLSR